MGKHSRCDHNYSNLVMEYLHYSITNGINQHDAMPNRMKQEKHVTILPKAQKLNIILRKP